MENAVKAETGSPSRAPQGQAPPVKEATDDCRARGMKRKSTSLKELPTLPRKTGITTLSHYMLEAMQQDFEMETITRLRGRLATVGPKEQVHYMLRILPERLQRMLQAEQTLRGSSENVALYAGELIVEESEARSAQPATPSIASRADRHPLWQALATPVRNRKHGWELAGIQTKIGPRKLAKREELLTDCGPLPWGESVSHLAEALVVGPLDLLRELQDSVAASRRSAK